ncbi:D-erythronate dehydrogenase [Nioella aestuarii]|uniref:D-erythronate dehydrogenase n=1 Tax=Nioella aestuarii TaxID=1662864 RepID=UPI003D7F39DC
MNVLIIGGGGMIGARLARKLVEIGALNDVPITQLTLADIAAPAAPKAPFPVTTLSADITSAGDRAKLLAGRPDVIFQLAAIVSGAAEADFDLGYRVNLGGVQALLEDIRVAGTCPVVVSTSSVAVFGGTLPDLVPDTHHLTPQSSYGTQKAMAELLLADHSRKGHLDGRTVRLPTITVRPGKPNAAASSFVSGIIREPLAGQRATLPVPRDTGLWIASPDCAVDTLIHASGLPRGAIGPGCAVNGRGLTVTAGQMLQALERAAGPKIAALVDETPDLAIAAIVTSWPRAFTCDTARALGFPVDDDIDAIIALHINENPAT